MNLQELLEELREGILHDFSNQVSGASDYLWTDQRLVRYINEAQRRFARESLCLRDGSTPEVCSFTLEAFKSDYPLHKSILGVVSAKLRNDKFDLARANHAAFSTYYKPDNYYLDTSFLASLPPNKVLAFDTDEYISRDERGTLSRVTLKVYPVSQPAFLDKVDMRVVRLPIAYLTLGKYKSIGDIPPDQQDALLNIIPEIPEEHHLDMLDWAAHLALRIVDHEMGDPERAAEFAASFADKVKKAKENAMRKMFAPSLWGFGRNGFSWESGTF